MEKNIRSRRVVLGELGSFRNGVNFSKEQMGTGFKLINVKDLFGDSPRIDFTNLDLVDIDKKSNFSEISVEKNDLFFVRSSVKRDGVGLVRIAEHNSKDTIHCGFIIRFRLHDTQTDPLFLTYFLRTPISRQAVINLSGGSAITNISQLSLSSLEIDIPPLPTQRKIAAILSAYDDLIENNTRRIKILEQIAQAIYREWFVHFRLPGYESVKLVDSGTELGMVPEGWEVRNLGDVCRIVMGQSPPSEFYNQNGDGLPFHQGVADFGDRFPVDRNYCVVKNRIADQGDILLSVRAPVGRLNIATKQIVIGRGLCAIRSKTENQPFIFQNLREIFFENDLMGSGTIYKSVTKDDVYGIKLIYPLNQQIENFEEIIIPIFRQIEVLTQKSANLKKTRDLLLPKLVSGELEVSELEIEAGENHHAPN